MMSRLPNVAVLGGLDFTLEIHDSLMPTPDRDVASRS